jgi:uncharacterized protein (TIGR00369 family)
MCGFEGIVHGGMSGLLMDEIAQWTLLSTQGRMGMTRDMTVHFHRAIRTGELITISGRVTAEEDKALRVATEIHTEDGNLAADGEVVYMMVSEATMARISGVPEETIRKFRAHYPVDPG